ncbi:MAG TPA: hypothetical protein VFT04_00075 [Gemmatimonadales bacterium]|nr:hypothetical protein [Gemmatimonadales bacterium]
MPSALPFTVRTRSPEQVTAGRVQTVEERYSGVVRLSESGLHLEWSGRREHTDTRSGSVTSRVEQLPVARIVIPARGIMEATLRWRWWRPYVRLRVNDVGSLEGFPGANATECRLRISREDRARAVEFITDLRLLMADAELRAAEEASAAIDAASDQSFPASDPPPFTPLRIGGPAAHPDPVPDDNG